MTCGACGLTSAGKAGSKDSPILKRYEGSTILSNEFRSFAEFSPITSNKTEEGRAK